MSLGWFLIALSLNKDWKDDVQALDEMVKTKQSKADMIKLAAEFIRSHSNVKQLSQLLAIEFGSINGNA